MEFEERQRKRELKAKLLAEKQQTGANSLPLGEKTYYQQHCQYHTAAAALY